MSAAWPMADNGHGWRATAVDGSNTNIQPDQDLSSHVGQIHLSSLLFRLPNVYSVRIETLMLMSWQSMSPQDARGLPLIAVARLTRSLT